MTGTKGRAFIYDWNRNRQRQMEEEFKKKKKREEETRKLLAPSKHHD